MKIKLDENLSRRLQAPLMALGHDVKTAAEEGLLSKPDGIVANAAKAEDRMLFTLDLDFADLRRFPPGSHPGIVLFVPPTLGPMAVHRFVLAFAAQRDLEDLSGTLAVVEPGRIRVRRSSP